MRPPAVHQSVDGAVEAVMARTGDTNARMKEQASQLELALAHMPVREPARHRPHAC
jgi:hypothetical protein